MSESQNGGNLKKGYQPVENMDKRGYKPSNDYGYKPKGSPSGSEIKPPKGGTAIVKPAK